MKQKKSPSTILHPCSQHDSVTLPHTSFDTLRRAWNSPTPLLLLHICSTTINTFWNPKNLLCEALGLTALQQSLHTHLLRVPSPHYRGIPCLLRKKKMEGNKGEWLQKEWKITSERARENMWLEKPVIQTATLLHVFLPRACTSSGLQSSKDLWNLGEHHISWGALHKFPGSVCLPGHPSTWSYSFSTLRSSPYFLQCHHLREVSLLYYNPLQHL